MSSDPELRDQLLRVAERAADRAIANGTQLRRLHFDLARALRGVPGADDAVSRDPEAIFEPVAAWCRIMHAHPSDHRDVPWGEESHRDVLVQVLDAWPKVLVVGEGAVAAAVVQARRAPIVLLDPLDRYGPMFAMIAGTAYHLQRYRGDADIFLSCRMLGAELGLHYTRVGPHLTMACTHALLRLTRPASFKKHEAACYRFELASPLYRPPSAHPGPAVGDVAVEEAMQVMGATITDDTTGERLIPAREIFPVARPTKPGATRMVGTQRPREPGEDDVELPF